MSSGKTIDDYKRDVVQLKGMINKLSEKQRELLKRYEGLKHVLTSDLKQNEIIQLSTIISSAITVQRYWRGFLARKFFFRKLKDLEMKNDENPRDVSKLNLSSAAVPKRNDAVQNRQLVQKINREVEKKTGLDLAMLFRALDEESVQSIAVETLQQFLVSNLPPNKIRESELKRLLFLLDEGCSGYITKQEIHTCLSAYGVNFDGSSAYSRTLQLEVLLNFAYRCSLKSFSPSDTYSIINTNHSAVLSQSDIKQFVLRNLQYEISDKEADVLYTAFDIYQNGKVTEKQFVKILEKATESAMEQQQKTAKRK